MKYWIASLAAVAVLLPLSFAPLLLAGDEPPKVMIVRVEPHDLGEDAVELDLSDLEVGESRSAWTESGKEIVATRTEDGHVLTLDGEEIDLPRIDRGRLRIHESGDVVALGDRDLDLRILEAAAGLGDAASHGAHVVRVGGKSVGERLAESGALDRLDEVTRQRILDELAEITAPREVHRILVERHARDDEGDDSKSDD